MLRDLLSVLKFLSSSTYSMAFLYTYIFQEGFELFTLQYLKLLCVLPLSPLYVTKCITVRKLPEELNC